MQQAVAPYVRHKEIKTFAEHRVNLPYEDVKKRRVQVNAMRDRLAEHIAEHPDYALVKALHSGSAAKGTGLKVGGDLDCVVYIRPDAAPADDRDLPSWLMERLREANSRLGADQFIPQDHCVTVEFRGTGLKVDVAAVLCSDVGSQNDGYLIQKDTGQRVLTNIPRHLEFIRSRKNECPVHYRQVIRLVKWWIWQQKLQNGLRFKSFMAELICSHLLDAGQAMDDYVAALGALFEYIVVSQLRERIAFEDYYTAEALPAPTGAPIEIFDPVNPENNVAALYAERDRRAIVEAAHAALDAIDEAEYATTKGRAVEAWRTILGPSFRV